MTRIFAVFILLAVTTAVVPVRAQMPSPPGAPQIPVYQRGQAPQFQMPPPTVPTVPIVPAPPPQPTYIVPAGPNGFAVEQNGKTVNCIENPYVISCQ